MRRFTRNLIFIVLFLVIQIPAFSQTIEELESKLANAEKAEKAGILNKLAYLYRKTNPAKCIDYANKAIEQAKSMDNKTDELSGYLYGGYGYYFSYSYAKAAEYFEKSLKISDAIGNKTGLNSIYSNLADCYLRTSKCNDAEKYFLKGLALVESSGNKPAIADFYEKIGLANSCKKDYKKALEWLNKSKDIFENLNQQDGMAVVYDDIGCVYQNYGNYNEAMNYLNKALAAAQKANAKDLIKKINIDIEAINKNKDVTSNALTQHEKDEKQKKEAMLKEKQEELMKNKFAISEKEQQLNQKDEIIVQKEQESQEDKKQISTLDKEKKKTQAELEKERIESERQRELVQKKQQLIILFISLLGVILASSLLLWRQFRLTRKAYKKLYVQNEEIKRQKTRIEEQAAELKKLSIVASKTDNAVMIMDAEGNFEWINESFKRIYGYTIEDFKKQNCNNIKKLSLQIDIKNIVEACVRDKKTVTYETPTNTGFGYKVWSQTNLTPILNENGEVIKIVAIDSDITKIKNAEEEIRAKNIELEDKNLLITDSINYAKTIQEAILPSKKIMQAYFPEYFIYYKPRDIVSGDFYWFGELNSKIYIATVDCTGHGVPGGFMSMIGHALLNEIILEKKIALPSDILNELNSKVITVLHKDSNIITHQEDGMDITVCCIDRKNREIQFSLANHTAYLIGEKETITVEGDMYSIGEILTQRFAHKYLNQVFRYAPGTILFMFSDGFKDQFGGTDKRKYSSDRFFELLKKNSSIPIESIPEKLSAEFETWKTGEDQVDDVLVVGIKL
ncbi:MAG: tetratricopeptide repeat protein [Bacteroidia bacterium]|nr:tetratricopeptide repeat protein [Bacteroidia bacterium]